MSNIKSKVMTAANRLVKGGMRRSLAMIKAWALAKADGLRYQGQRNSTQAGSFAAACKAPPRGRDRSAPQRAAQQPR